MYAKYEYSTFGGLVDCLYEFSKLIPSTELSVNYYVPGISIAFEDSEGYYYVFTSVELEGKSILVGTILTDIKDQLSPFTYWRETGLLGSELDESGTLKYVTFFPCLRQFVPHLYINYTDKILSIVTKTDPDTYCDSSKGSMIYFGLSKLCTGKVVPLMGGVNCYKVIMADSADENYDEESMSKVTLAETPKLIHPLSGLYAPICFVRSFMDLAEIPDKSSVWVLPYYCKDFMPVVKRKFQYCFVNYSVYTTGVELSTQGALNVGLPVYDDLYLGWQDDATQNESYAEGGGAPEMDRHVVKYVTRDTPPRTVNTLNCIALIMPLYLYIIRQPEILENYSYICDLKFLGAVSLYNMKNGRRIQSDFPDRQGIFQCFYMETYRRAWGGVTVEEDYWDEEDEDYDNVRESFVTGSMWYDSPALWSWDAPFQRHFYGIAIKHDDDEIEDDNTVSTGELEDSETREVEASILPSDEDSES